MKEFWIDPCGWSSQSDPMSISHDAYICENPSGYEDKEKLIHTISFEAYLEMKQRAEKAEKILKDIELLIANFPNYVAHPQSVWFKEHITNKLKQVDGGE